MSKVRKRVALITGASKGIGKAVFNQFKTKGYTVLGIARTIKKTSRTRRCDITDEHETKRLFAGIIREFGRLDVLVNCAGAASCEDIARISKDDWNYIIETNLTGTFLCSKFALQKMKKQKFGKIVNIGSLAGRYRSRVASVAYTASKAGVIGLTRQLAYHYAKYNININCVCPSQTKTPMLMKHISKAKQLQLVKNIPAGRLATAREIAEVVYFLTTDSASYINGAVLDVNGAQ